MPFQQEPNRRPSAYDRPGFASRGKCLTVDPSFRITKTLEDGSTVRTEFLILSARRCTIAVDGGTGGGELSSTVVRDRNVDGADLRAVRGYPARILDTRKTTPGLSALEKWAVRLGGGFNHRHSLGDGILIKDNHIELLKSQDKSVTDACRLAREHGPHGLRIIVEAQSLAQVRDALKGHADVILLDNMSPSQVRGAGGRHQRARPGRGLGRHHPRVGERDGGGGRGLSFHRRIDPFCSGRQCEIWTSWPLPNPEARHGARCRLSAPFSL